MLQRAISIFFVFVELGLLARCGSETIRRFYGEMLEEREGRPGMRPERRLR